MTSPDVPAAGRPADRVTLRPLSLRLNVRRQPTFSLGRWPATRRLVAVIVVGVAVGLAMSGLWVASAVSAAAGFARTAQLAVLGQQATALAQALENERDLAAAYDAAAGLDGQPDSAGVPSVPKAGYAARQAQMLQAQAVTTAVAARLRPLAVQIGGSFPPATQSDAAAVVSQIGILGALESQSRTQSSLSTIQSYNGAIAPLFALIDDITSGSGDAVLGSGVRTLDALSRAKDQASQQRAILSAALIDGQFTAGAQQALLTSQALENAYLLTFQSSATKAEVSSYVSTVAGQRVDTAQLLNNYFSVPAAGCAGARIAGAAACAGALSLRAGALGKAYATGAPQVYYTDMSATIDRMRTVELQVAQGVVARSQALRQGAVRSAVVIGTVTFAIAAAVLFATFIATRPSEGDERRNARSSAA